MRWLLTLAFFVSCAEPRPALDGGVEAIDSGLSDAGTAKGVFDAGLRPAGPTFGELTYWQLGLGGTQLGEAGVLVGPDGTVVLVDVGGSRHDDEVRAALRELNTQWLTLARGYAARQPLEVDWLVLTHFHGDHIGAFGALTQGAEPLLITRGVIHRGFVDVGAATNEADFSTLCLALRGALATKNVPLCTATPESACTISGRAPASGCPGLLRGDLSTEADDALALPAFISLGGGARLEFLAAGGFARQGSAVVAGPVFGVTETNEENARSVVGLVSHGAFRFLFAGDLSGSGAAGEPDVESFVIQSHAAHFGSFGVDVAHANHHARKTSSNQAWVNGAAPIDGRTRNVIAGITSAYLNSPHAEVLDGWLSSTRLGSGGFYVTQRPVLGATNPALVDVGGRITVQTTQGGDGYWLMQRAWPAVRR